MDAALNDDMIRALKNRFEKNMDRHNGFDWSAVQAKLEANVEKLQALHEMERTGGEPEVIGYDQKTGEFAFCDCSLESPIGRRSLCYDRDALESRKENKPGGSAIEMASAMGIEMLTEEQYRELQRLGKFDRKTSSWVQTSSSIESLAVPFSATVAMIMYSSITTVLNPTTLPEGSAVYSKSRSSM